VKQCSGFESSNRQHPPSNFQRKSHPKKWRGRKRLEIELVIGSVDASRGFKVKPVNMLNPINARAATMMAIQFLLLQQASSTRQVKKHSGVDEAASHHRKILGISPKIVGGTPAGNGKYPSCGFNAGDVGLCGGTLIHPDIVMTAAHCSKEFADGWYQGGNTVNGAASEFAAVALELPHPN